jgi:glutathione S-transferase
LTKTAGRQRFRLFAFIRGGGPLGDNLVLYTNPMSRGRIARWMMEEIGQPYEAVTLDYMTTLKAPDYLAINPMGKIPALTHGDVVVTECGAICAYLADAFPQAGLAPPPGSKARAAYYRWMFFAAGPVEAAVTNKVMGFELAPGKERSAGYGSLAAVLDALEQAVTKTPYLAGDQFTAADIYAGSQIGFGLQFGTMEKRPAFVAYWNRVSARPAYARAGALDDASMPKKPR